MEIVLSNQQLSWYGGVETYTFTMAEQLQRLGHQPARVVRDVPGHELLRG